MRITADSMSSLLGKRMFLLFLALEMATGGLRVLFLSASERTDTYLRIHPLKGLETFFLDRNFGDSPRRLEEFLQEPVPNLFYLASPRSLNPRWQDIEPLSTTSGYDVVISEYHGTTQPLTFYLLPPNIRYLRNNRPRTVWTNAIHPVIAGLSTELITPERVSIYQDILGKPVQFLPWEPALTLIPYEQDLLDYYASRQDSGYLQAIRRISCSLLPAELVAERAPENGIWQRFRERRKNHGHR